MGFDILIGGLVGNLIAGLSDKIKGKINKDKLTKNIEKVFQETSGKSQYAHILSRLSFNKDFTETIWQISKGKIIDCNNLVELSLTISKAEKLNLSKTQIITALKIFSLDLFNVFAAKNAELGKIPAAIHDFHDSMKNLSLMTDCFSALVEEKIKDARYSDLEAKLRELKKEYEELQISVAKRDKEDNLTPEIQKNLEICNFGKAEKLLLQSFDKKTKNAAQDAYQLAKLKHIQLEYKQAKKYYKEAVRLSPNNSLYLNNLGCILQELGDYNKAIKYFQKALEIDLKTSGNNHPNTARDLNNIGIALQKLGEYKKAINYFQKAFNIVQKVLGDNHPEVAIRYNNIGAALRELGEYNEAIEYYKKALNIDLKAFGDNHPNIAIRYNNIGLALKYLGEYNEAIKYLQKALEILKNTLGENHPNTATTYNNIGEALRELDEYKKAIDYFQKALEIKLKAFGDNHPNIATTYNNIGEALRSLGEYKKAIDYLQKAEKIRLQFLGADHPYTKSVKNSIKIAKQALNRK